MFFDGTDRIHQAMRKLAVIFEQRKIDYVIVGGMAVNAHRYIRTTGDVDFLVRPEGLLAIQQLVSEGLLNAVPGRTRRFTEPETHVQVDLLVTGFFPGSGKPGPISYPQPDGVAQVINNLRYINLRNLIELKLAARRHKDFADVVDLIRHNDLDESFMSQIHPTVHKDFIECLEEKRREDEYEKRRGC